MVFGSEFCEGPQWRLLIRVELANRLAPRVLLVGSSKALHGSDKRVSVISTPASLAELVRFGKDEFDYVMFSRSEPAGGLRTLERCVALIEFGRSTLVILRPSSRLFGRVVKSDVTLELAPEAFEQLTLEGKLFRWENFRSVALARNGQGSELALVAQLLIDAPSVSIVETHGGEAPEDIEISLASLKAQVESLHEILRLLKLRIRRGSLDASVYAAFQTRVIDYHLTPFTLALESQNLSFFATLKLASASLLGDASQEVWLNAKSAHKEILHEAMVGSRASTLRLLQASHS